MATFNPDVPDQKIEDYYKTSHAISQKEGNKSAGIALAGAGDLFSSAVKVTDEGIKSYLSEDVRNDVEATRTEMTQNTQALEDILSGRTVVKAPGSFPDQGPGLPVPTELKDLPKLVQNIFNAKTARKDLDTYYDAMLLDKVKKYRDSFPGYRDYIDATVSSITQRDPANDLLNKTIAKIGQLTADSNNKRDRTLAEIDKQVTSGNVFAMSLRRGYLAGQFNEDFVFQKLGEYNFAEWNHKNEKRELDSFKGSQELAKLKATEIAENRVSALANRYFTATDIGAGKTPMQIAEELRSGNIKDPQLLQTYATMLQAQKNKFIEEATNEFNKSGEGGSPSISARVGTDIDKIIQRGATLFDLNTKFATSGDTSLMGASKVINEAMVQDKQNQWFTNKDFGEVAKMLALANGMGPIVGPILAEKVIASVPDFNIKMGAFVGTMTLKHSTQPNLPDGKVSTVVESVDELKKKGIFLPETVSKLINQIDGKQGLTNLGNSPGERELKKNLVLAFYHPGNATLLANFEKEGYSVVQNKVVAQGKYSVFSRLYSPEVTRIVRDLAKDNPEIWEMYKNSADRAYSNDLLRTELKDFKQLPTWDMDPRIRITYDDKTHSFYARAIGAGNAEAPEASLYHTQTKLLRPQINRLQRQLDRINIATNLFADIAKAENKSPEDVNAYVLNNLIQRSEVDLTSGRFTGIPQMMIDSIVNTKKKEEEEAKLIKSQAKKK